MKNKSYLPHLSALAATLIWGGSYVWSTQVFRVLKPATTVMLRLVISSLFLLCLLFLFKKNEKIKRKDWPLFLVAALLEPFLYHIGESYGLVRVSPTISSAIIATIPLFAPFTAYLFLKEKVGAWNLVGFVVSFLGVLVMLINKNLQFMASTEGILFLFGAVIVAVCYNIALKKLTERYNPLTIVAVGNTIGLIYFIPFVLLTERDYLPSILLVQDYIGPLLLLGILASSGAYVFWTYTIEKLGVARSNVYINTIPIFTAAFSYILIKEDLNASKIAGIALVIMGLILSQIRHNQSKKSTHTQLKA